MKNLENTKAAAVKLVAADAAWVEAVRKWEAFRGNGTPEGRAYKNETLEPVMDDLRSAQDEMDREWRATESQDTFPYILVGDKIVTRDEDSEWQVWTAAIVVGV